MITLKDITTEEIEKLLSIAEQENIFVKSKDDANKTITEIVSHFKDNKDYHPFKVDCDGITVGFITSFPYKTIDTLSLGVMYILEEHRGKGYGKEMVDLFIQCAEPLGFKKIFTKTWSKNISSQKLFIDFDFIEVGKKLNDRVDGDDTMEYLKIIS